MPRSKLLSHYVKNLTLGIQSLVNVRHGLFSTCKGKLRVRTPKEIPPPFKFPGLEEELIMEVEKQDFGLELTTAEIVNKLVFSDCRQRTPTYTGYPYVPL